MCPFARISPEPLDLWPCYFAIYSSYGWFLRIIEKRKKKISKEFSRFFSFSNFSRFKIFFAWDFFLQPKVAPVRIHIRNVSIAKIRLCVYVCLFPSKFVVFPRKIIVSAMFWIVKIQILSVIFPRKFPFLRCFGSRKFKYICQFSVKFHLLAAIWIKSCFQNIRKNL